MRLPTASYGLPSRNASRLLNVYAQASQTKGPVEIVGTPGVVTSRVLEGQGRGFAVLRGTLYVVAGDTLYGVLDGLEKGTITGTSRLTFCEGTTQLVADTGYIYDGTTLAAIADGDAPPFAAVGFSDGRLLYVERNTGRFGGSALNDLGDYAALDFATAEGSPDNLLTLVIVNRDVHLLGVNSCEEWWNSGASGFPYERKAGGFREIGVAGRLAAVKADNTVFMIASDRTARVLRGSTWVKVSQTGVEEAFSGYSTLADCEATSYTWHGNVFVSFLFPSADACWVFNVTTSEWFERDPTWAAVIEHGGKVWVQHMDGRVGYLSDAVSSEFGESVIREVTWPNIYAANARATHSQIDFVFRTGDAPIGVTPKAQLDISDDGGNTWLSLPYKGLGLTGQYRNVVRWTRLGQARDRVYRVRVSDAVPFHIVDAQLEVAGGEK
jgi:hypothetical protein